MQIESESERQLLQALVAEDDPGTRRLIGGLLDLDELPARARAALRWRRRPAAPVSPLRRGWHPPSPGMAVAMTENNDPDTLEEPTPDEEAAAERAAEESPDIEDTYRDMTEKGAHQKGEGAV